MGRLPYAIETQQGMIHVVYQSSLFGLCFTCGFCILLLRRLLEKIPRLMKACRHVTAKESHGEPPWLMMVVQCIERL